MAFASDWTFSLFRLFLWAVGWKDRWTKIITTTCLIWLQSLAITLLRPFLNLLLVLNSSYWNSFRIMSFDHYSHYIVLIFFPIYLFIANFVRINSLHRWVWLTLMPLKSHKHPSCLVYAYLVLAYPTLKRQLLQGHVVYVYNGFSLLRLSNMESGLIENLWIEVLS